MTSEVLPYSRKFRHSSAFMHSQGVYPPHVHGMNAAAGGADGDVSPPVSPRTVPACLTPHSTPAPASPESVAAIPPASVSTSPSPSAPTSKTYEHLRGYPVITDSLAALGTFTAYTVPFGASLTALATSAAERVATTATTAAQQGTTTGRVLGGLDMLGDRVLSGVDYVAGPRLRQPTAQLFGDNNGYVRRARSLASGLRARAFPLSEHGHGDAAEVQEGEQALQHLEAAAGKRVQWAVDSVQDARTSARDSVNSAVRRTSSAAQHAHASAQQAGDSVQASAQKARDSVRSAVKRTTNAAQDSAQHVQQQTAEATQRAHSTLARARDSLNTGAHALRRRASTASDSLRSAADRAGGLLVGTAYSAGTATARRASSASDTLRNTMNRAGGLLVGTAYLAGSATARRGSEVLSFAASSSAEAAARAYNAVAAEVERELAGAEPLTMPEDEARAAVAADAGPAVWSRALRNAISGWAERQAEAGIETGVQTAVGAADAVVRIGARVVGVV